MNELIDLLQRIFNNAAYMANKADTNNDRDEFEHIRKQASRALALAKSTCEETKDG